jgi:hypothetical protein
MIYASTFDLLQLEKFVKVQFSIAKRKTIKITSVGDPDPLVRGMDPDPSLFS